jgi:hypothetical protein
MLLSVVQMIAAHYYTSQRLLQPLDAVLLLADLFGLDVGHPFSSHALKDESRCL